MLKGKLAPAAGLSDGAPNARRAASCNTSCTTRTYRRRTPATRNHCETGGLVVLALALFDTLETSQQQLDFVLYLQAGSGTHKKCIATLSKVWLPHKNCAGRPSTLTRDTRNTAENLQGSKTFASPIESSGHHHLRATVVEKSNPP